MLYQLSYIGPNPAAKAARLYDSQWHGSSRALPRKQPSALSRTLLRIGSLAGMQHVIPPQDRLHREQRQNRQRTGPKLGVGNRNPGQRTQHRVANQRNGQAIHRFNGAQGRIRTSVPR